jgi:hypothetical protein
VVEVLIWYILARIKALCLTPISPLGPSTGMTMSHRLRFVLVACLSLAATVSAAQPLPLEGPEAKPVIRAIAAPDGYRVDGRLDEAIYGTVSGAIDFYQQEPHEGELATEKTELWVLFDSKNLYLAFRMWDSQPERMIANEMRRDQAMDIYNNENMSVVIDTFHDQRSGYYFMSNMLGAMRDVQFQSETQSNGAWNPVWNPRAQKFDGGWTLEMAIPFKSVRYPAGKEQTWGINFRRAVRWKNEISFITRIPASVGAGGIYRLEDEATLVGLKVPAAGKNLDIIPFFTARSTTNKLAQPALSNKFAGDVGVDVKYGVTKGLSADFTYNTDFAQVEDDLQQVNLTRFGVFFPEKRTFFLEGQGIFDFGGQTGGGNNAGAGDIPSMFFSRQIGLVGGTPVPIIGGGRLSGKVGKYSIGIVDIQTEKVEAIGASSTNFGVLRLRRDILQKSYVGVLATRQTPSDGLENTMLGVDANIAYGVTMINAYVARTDTPGRHGQDLSYMGQYDYNAERYGISAQRLVVGKNFNPEMGFLRRRDFRTSSAAFRFSPRPAQTGSRFKSFRKFYFRGSADHTTNNAGRLESRAFSGDFNFDLNSGGIFGSSVMREYEGLESPFRIAQGVSIPVGGYGFTHATASYQFPATYKVRGSLRADLGEFYDGTKQTVSYSGRVELSKQLTLEPTLSLNWVDLPVGSFKTNLIQSKVTFTVSPRTALGVLVQYNSSAHTLSTNVRFRWEYIPGSDLYVVYNEGRTTVIPDRLADLQNRTFVVKLTRLLRY